MAATKIEASNIAAGAVASTGFTSVQTFTASGTWTRPTDITKVIVEVQGGGAGGGQATGASYYQGGSAGGYAKKFIDVSSISTSPIVIGVGGAGSTVNGTAGADGGDSSWTDGTNTVTGVKGVGQYGHYATALGGLATGGDINIQGGAGRGSSTSGGHSMLGVGGFNGWTGENAVQPGTGYGSGGGGAYGVNGAAGAGGIVIVWEFK